MHIVLNKKKKKSADLIFVNLIDLWAPIGVRFGPRWEYVLIVFFIELSK